MAAGLRKAAEDRRSRRKQMDNVHHLAFSDFCHLDVNSLPFALRLRDSPSDVIGMSVLPPDADRELRAEMEAKRKERIEAHSDQVTKDKAREQILLPCRNKQCETVRRRIEQEYAEKEKIIQSIRELSEKKAELEGRIAQTQMMGARIGVWRKKMLTDIKMTESDVESCRRRMEDATQEKRDLNKKIEEMIKQRTILRREVQNASICGKKINYDEWGPKLDLAMLTLTNQHPELPSLLEHSGVVHYSEQLKMDVWSCCLKPKEMSGCLKKQVIVSPGRLFQPEIPCPAKDLGKSSSKPVLQETMLQKLEEDEPLINTMFSQTYNKLRPHTSAGFGNSTHELFRSSVDMRRPETAPDGVFQKKLQSLHLNKTASAAEPKSNNRPDPAFGYSTRPSSASPGTLKIFRQESTETKRPDERRKLDFPPGAARRQAHNKAVLSRSPSAAFNKLAPHYAGSSSAGLLPPTSVKF